MVTNTFTYPYKHFGGWIVILGFDPAGLNIMKLWSNSCNAGCYFEGFVQNISALQDATAAQGALSLLGLRLVLRDQSLGFQG